MGAMDWERIISADVTLLNEDDEAAEDYFDMLTQADFRDKDLEASDPKLMLKLFHVAKAVLAMKSLHYETAVEELQTVAQVTYDEREAAHAGDQAKIEGLEAELAQSRKYPGSGDKYFRTEISQLEDRNQILQSENEDLKTRLLKEQNAFDKVNLDFQALDREHLEMKKELEEANANIKEYKRQWSSQNDVSKAQAGNVHAIREEITKKNREISGYLDDIKNLQVANDQLQADLNNAKDELEQATGDMNSMANRYSKLKTILEDTEKVLEGMRKERDHLRLQFQDMQLQMQSKNDSDDQIMSALNEKVSEWKDLVASKDAEIKTKQQEVNELQKRLQASLMDSDHNAMMKLTEENALKDEKIENLKEKLQLATKDYQEVTSQIHTLKTKSKDGSPSVYQQKKIQKLTETIGENQTRINREKERVVEAERDVVDKDRQIAELVNKVIQYEQGQYGLSEAVKELKASRAQIRVRDSHIQELTQQVNKLYIELNDLGLENEEMRERLGLESRAELDLVAIRKKKAIKEEQTVALNSVLQKEVEKLEEERVQLKKALRQQALDRGEKAVELGLSAKDLEPLDDSFTDNVSQRSRSPRRTDVSQKGQILVHYNDDKDNQMLVKQMKTLEEEIKELKEENNQFEIGLREINGVLLQGVGPSSTIQVPAMEKLIAIIEQRNATGQYDTTLHLKQEMHHLSGRNEELRSELRNAQAEITNAIVELDKRAQKIDDQENEINMLRDASESVLKLNPLPLPDGVAPTSKEIIACLNEYLIQILQELSNKEELCLRMQNALEEMRRNYSVAKHQQSILYKEHFELKEARVKERKELEDEKDNLLLQKSQDAVRIREFDKLISNLETFESNPKKILAELTRKITVLRVNEKSLTRRYTIIQDVEKNLQKDNSKIRKEILDMEAAVTAKIGDLERHKEMSCYKITSLQKQLEETVPAYELEMANKQFNELTAKYRDVLQRENNLVGRSNAIEGLQAEIAAYQHTDKTLKEKLQQEKERSYVLEQTLNDLLYKLGKNAEGNPPRSEEISSFARKLATLEMKELNEKERADHASMKYDHLRTLTAELEKRNTELETKFSEIAKLNLECQRVERDLREQLDGSVPVEVNRVDKELICKLEEREGTLKTECHKLKEIADISQHQVETVTLKQQSQEKELTSLRRQLYELQMETDEKTIIAKLHQQIVAMQVSESAAVRKYEVASSKLSKADTHILKLQKLVDEKDDALHHLRAETRSKSRFLKKTIQDLRRQFSGALTLGAQERFNDVLRVVQEKRDEYEKKLNEIKLNHSASEDRAVQLKLQNDGLQELIATLKDGQGAKKVAEWHNRMGEIKLEDMKLKRKIEMDKEQLSYLERIISKHESSISVLEKDLTVQSKEFQDRQLLWEQHEVELERTIAKLEGQHKELGEAARKFEEATGSIPDDTLPIANQLEIAISSIKQHIKTIIVTRAECKRMNEVKEEADAKLRAAETALMQKDKVINELRIRLPFSERDITYAQALETSSHSPTEPNAEAAQAVKIAQTTIESLKLMLQKKDENISKYQDMLKKAREDLKSQMVAHQQEIKVLQERLQLEIEEHVKKMKKVHHDYLNAPQQEVPTNKQIRRLVEVEEMLVEQDNALGAAALKYNITQEDMKRIKDEAQNVIKTLNERIQLQQKENETALNNFNEDIEKVKTTVREKEMEIEVLSQELESVRDANKKAPSRTMKNLVERLRDQLAKKDKEQKALSQALLQIQSDMVCSAEENVKAYAKKVEDEMSVQILVDKETTELRSRIEDLQARVDKMKKELKKKKETESKLAAELEAMTLDMHTKDAALKEVGAGLKGVEDLKAKYDQLKQENKRLTEQLKKVPVVEAPIQPMEAFVAQHEGFVDMTDLDDKPVKESKPIGVEKPSGKETKGKDEVIRWEENKKWQKKFDTLKAKLKEKLEECEKLNKTNGMLREGFSRQEKDKLALQNKLKSLSRGLAPTDVYGMTKEHEETISGLKQRIFHLEEENNNLSRQLNLDRDKEIQELRIQLSQQNESINALETQLLNRQKDEDRAAYNWTMEREKSLKKEMLAIRKENMELVFEKEQANKDVPRLKARVADLNGYVEVLKGEINTHEKKEKQRKGTMGSGMGGQSVEDMERVICAMRRVVERLQVENEALKKQTGKSKPARIDLTKENRALKQEVQKLKQLQATENKKVPQPRNNPKLIETNDKLCADLHKEREEKEELKVEKQSLEIRIMKLLETIEEKDNALANIDKPTVNPQMEYMLNKAANEEQLQTMQEEIHKKNAVLKDIKIHLRAAAEREAGLLRQVDELEEKVQYLQQFPPGVQTENDAAKQLQQCRLQIKRLEAEKKELTYELQRLNKLTNHGEKPIDVTQDEVLSKLRNYDKMMTTEVDLRMKTKVLEVEKEKLQSDCRKLKEELSAFDPAFFEELEDLKYNYKVSIERNVLYERQLRQFSAQFGVQINIPNDDGEL